MICPNSICYICAKKHTCVAAVYAADKSFCLAQTSCNTFIAPKESEGAIEAMTMRNDISQLQKSEAMFADNFNRYTQLINELTERVEIAERSCSRLSTHTALIDKLIDRVCKLENDL